MQWFVDNVKSLVPCGFFLVVCGGIFGWTLLFGRGRTRRMKGVARKMGVFFGPGFDPKPAELVPQFEGSEMRLAFTGFNTLRVTLNIAGHPVEAMLGDCSSIPRTDPWMSLVADPESSYAAFQFPFAGVRDIVIRPDPSTYTDSKSERARGAGLLGLGLTGVEFESSEFNRMFNVFSSDRRFAYALVTPQMMEFLLSTRPPPIFIQRGWCVIGADLGARWKPEYFAAIAEWIPRFMKLWPAYLLEDLPPLSTRGGPRDAC